MSSKSGLNAAPSTHPAQPTCGDRTTIAVRLPIHRPAMYVPRVTEQALYILASLARGECHGYGIARDAEELSGGRVRLSAGTLYGALNRLADDGLVEAAGERQVQGRRRRYYRITGLGQTALADEVERLRATAAALGARVRAALA